jgi:cytochrome c-type biogenesis protein CcmH
MTQFWLIAGAMLLGALSCVAVPLMRRHGEHSERGAPTTRALLVSLYQQELAQTDAEFRAGTLSGDLHAAARRDLDAQLLDDVASMDARAARPGGSAGSIATRAGTAALLIALIPAGAFAMYLHLGEPAALTLDRTDGKDTSIEMMVTRLAIRLRDQPGDAESWTMLARSYFTLDRPADAAAAFARAVAMSPGDAQLHADYADAIASANGGAFGHDAAREIEAALRIDPANPKALALAGSAASDKRDYAAALGYWQRLSDALAPGTPAAAEARRNIDEARSMLAQRVTTPDAAR